jgi:hypothetical protein
MAKNDQARTGRPGSDSSISDLPKAKLTLANLKKSLRLFSYLG